MSDWKNVTLGDVCNFQEGYVNPSQKEPSYFGDEIKWLRANDLNESYVYETSRKLSRKGFESAGKAAKLFEPNTIAISKSGSIGKLGFLKDFMCGNRAVINIKPKPSIDVRFLFSLLKANQPYFSDMAVGSVQPNLYVSSLSSLEILLPPLRQQKSIASVLSGLDDKIDLLNRQNKTLEQIAETLFRQWFVEEANDDWYEVTINDYAEHAKVSVKPASKPLDKYAHFSIPGFDSGKEPVLETGQQIKSNKYQVFEHSILFSKLNPHKDKRVWLILEDLPKNAICSTEFQVIKPYNKNHLYFLYGWLTNSINYREISSGVGGTSGSHQRISPSEIFSFHVPKVSNEILEAYADRVKPIFDKQQNNQTQIRTLTTMRDTLLPKLMSGEARVESD